MSSQLFPNLTSEQIHNIINSNLNGDLPRPSEENSLFGFGYESLQKKILE
jgi:hypothetical protein